MNHDFGKRYANIVLKLIVIILNLHIGSSLQLDLGNCFVFNLKNLNASCAFKSILPV